MDSLGGALLYIFIGTAVIAVIIAASFGITSSAGVMLMWFLVVAGLIGWTCVGVSNDKQRIEAFEDLILTDEVYEQAYYSLFSYKLRYKNLKEDLDPNLTVEECIDNWFTNASNSEKQAPLNKRYFQRREEILNKIYGDLKLENRRFTLALDIPDDDRERAESAVRVKRMEKEIRMKRIKDGIGVK